MWSRWVQRGLSLYTRAGASSRLADVRYRLFSSQKLHPKEYTDVADSWYVIYICIAKGRPHEQTDPSAYVDREDDLHGVKVQQLNAEIRRLNELLRQARADCTKLPETPDEIHRAKHFSSAIAAQIDKCLASLKPSRAVAEKVDEILAMNVDMRDKEDNIRVAKEIAHLRDVISGKHDRLPDGSETLVGRLEDYSPPFYTKALLAIMVAAIAYRLATFYAKDEDESSSESSWFASADSQDPYADTRKWVALARKEADDQLILRELGHPDPISRIDFDGVFDRCRHFPFS